MWAWKAKRSLLLLCFCVLGFWGRVLLRSLDWPQTLNPLTSASLVQGLQICATTPGIPNFLPLGLHNVRRASSYEVQKGFPKKGPMSPLAPLWCSHVSSLTDWHGFMYKNKSPLILSHVALFLTRSPVFPLITSTFTAFHIF
jgi:hypothetical protein